MYANEVRTAALLVLIAILSPSIGRVACASSCLEHDGERNAQPAPPPCHQQIGTDGSSDVMSGGSPCHSAIALFDAVIAAPTTNASHLSAAHHPSPFALAETPIHTVRDAPVQLIKRLELPLRI